MITYQKESQEYSNGEVGYKYIITCKKSDLDVLPSELLKNGSLARTTDEGKEYIYDEENKQWNERG